MLIVEGPDCAGKTTLCKRLLEDLPTHVYSHLSRLPGGFDRYWGYAERMSRDVVQDRFHLSEVVYARMRGEEPRLTDEVYRLVDADLRRLGGYTVLTTVSDAVVRSRWTRDQMYSLTQTLEVARLFRTMQAGRYDIDYTVHCEYEDSYVTGTAVAEILEGYRRRRRVLDEVLGRRPARL